MTNDEIIQAIRNEIERLLTKWETAEHLAEGLLSFLSTLESEKPSEGLEEEYKDYVESDPVYSKLVNRNAGLSIARHFYELGCRRAAEKYDEIEYERQRAEESVSNDLEEAAVNIADELLAKPKDYALSAKADYWNGVHDGAIAGAEWQKEQDLAEMAQSKSPLPVAYANRCFENGKQAMKEQMMKEAVEISYKGGMARINGEEKPFDGGTVRVIFLPKED